MPTENNVLFEIARKIDRVETDVKHILRNQDDIKIAKDTATKALSSTQSAHKRLDKIDKLLTWYGTTIVGALIAGAIGLLFKFTN